MSSESYHEPFDRLSEDSRDLHRAIESLMEELEAVDWYQQRADVTGDDELRAVLEHNRDEEIEHACMVFEWLRRRVPKIAEEAETYLFTRGPITELEESATSDESSSGKESGPTASASSDGSLGIGSLK